MSIENISSKASAVQPTNKKGVPFEKQSKNMDERISHLNILIAELTDRLKPIMEIDDSPPKSETLEGPADSASSPLINMMISNNQKLSDLEEHLKSVISRLEI